MTGPLEVPAEAAAELDERAALDRVRAEIDAEVQRRRLSGELPAGYEEELDELFLKHSPFSGRDGRLSDVLRIVDRAAFIDPVVPVASAKSGGAVMKKAVRTLSFWYMSWVTNQISQFSSGVGRALHLVDEQLADIRRKLEATRVPAVPVVETPWAHHALAWWVPIVLDALEGARGRVLHGASGDGWLVSALAGRGLDAYGVDPRRNLAEEAALHGADLRGEPLLEHLESVADASLAAVVLSGVVEAMPAGERERLVSLVSRRLAPGGVLVVHSLAPSAWTGDDAPPEADLVAGAPYKAATWATFLPFAGFDVTVSDAPDGRDYLVVARAHLAAP